MHYVHSVNAFVVNESPVSSSASVTVNAGQVMCATYKVKSFLFFLNATTKSAPLMPANRMKATTSTEMAEMMTTMQTVQNIMLYICIMNDAGLLPTIFSSGGISSGGRRRRRRRRRRRGYTYNVR